MSAPRAYRYRGLVWPVLLILVGVFALLVNTNVIPSDRLYRLGDLWPLLLVVIGLELIVSRTPMPTPAAAGAAALILLLAAGGAVAYVAAGPAIPTGTQTLDASEPALSGLDHASLQVDVGAAVLVVRGSNALNGDLFRAHIEYSGPAPGVSLDRSTGHLEISQTNGFQLLSRQTFKMDLQVDDGVRWDLTVHSGSSTDTFNLSTVKVGSIELDTGASREDITLGPPAGSVPISVNGGALTVQLHRPIGTAASVNVSGGAVSLDFDGRQEHAIGTVSVSTDAQADMYHVQVSGGACTVTMDTNSPSG